MSMPTTGKTETTQGYANFQSWVAYAHEHDIVADKGEWKAFSTAVATAGNITEYASKCKDLWTDGEDTGAWTQVTSSARVAEGQDPDTALETVLLGFTRIERPAHNGAAWAQLRDNSYGQLRSISSHFNSTMLLVRQLNSGITEDDGEWQRYADICSDAYDRGPTAYVEGAATLWTDGEDQLSWTSIKNAAAAIPADSTDDVVNAHIAYGYFGVSKPSHNENQWGSLQQFSEELFVGGDGIVFNGTDTRPRRILRQPDRLPAPMDSSFLLTKGKFPAEYTQFFGEKVCHVEYFMRLDLQSASGAAYFVITHSQSHGGYIGLAKVEGKDVGENKADERITLHEPEYAGAITWWDHLDGDHPGGCNHPGNGGQIGTKVVLVGQDWTKWYPVHGHVVEPVGHGSKVLFYDFASLETDTLPSSTDGSTPTNAYLGCLTTEQLGLRAGDDGEISSVVVEQGPDGLFYLIGGNRNQTVCWVSPELVPDITKWRQIAVANRSLNDGSAMLSWATFGDQTALYYVTSGDNGMNLNPVNYLLAGGQVIGINVVDAGSQHTKQDDRFGSGDWVADNGSLYAGASGGVALYGAYKSIDDEKGPNNEKCVQVRAWYQDGV
jgi:hypothetical protein